MTERRGTDDRRELCSGPAKLTQALAIAREQNGLALGSGGMQVLSRPGLTAHEVEDPAVWSRGAPPIVATARIGISSATEQPWRFVDAESPSLATPVRRRVARTTLDGADVAPSRPRVAAT